jgi:hypothetical protein
LQEALLIEGSLLDNLIPGIIAGSSEEDRAVSKRVWESLDAVGMRPVPTLLALLVQKYKKILSLDAVGMRPVPTLLALLVQKYKKYADGSLEGIE